MTSSIRDYDVGLSHTAKITEEGVAFNKKVRKQMELEDVQENHHAQLNKITTLGICQSMPDANWRVRHNRKPLTLTRDGVRYVKHV